MVNGYLFPCHPSSRFFAGLTECYWKYILKTGKLVFYYQERKPVFDLNGIGSATQCEWSGDGLMFSGGVCGAIFAVNDCLFMELSFPNKLKIKIDRAGKVSPLSKKTIPSLIAHANYFLNAIPGFKWDGDAEILWRHIFILHRASLYPATGKLRHPWEVLCRLSPFQQKIFGHWDTLHIISDLMWFDLNNALAQFENYLLSFDKKSGMMSIDYFGDYAHAMDSTIIRNDGREMACSHPPLFPLIGWELYLIGRNRRFLKGLFAVCQKNVAWWEQNRDADGDGLFEYRDTYIPQLWESGYDRSPRFDNANDVPFPSIDLSCQLALYYQILAGMALELDDVSGAECYGRKAKALAGRIRRGLYDEKSGFYYDRNAEGLKKVKTIAGFWPLISGVASKRQAWNLARHLANPNEFMSYLPVPSVALNEKSYSKDCWRGPTFIAQNYWIIKGLRRYGMIDLAGEIAARSLTGATEVFKMQNRVFEFYDPEQSTLRHLKRKGSADGPWSYYIGHIPLHAIVLCGLYGVEMHRDGLAIRPSLAHLKPGNEIAFRFNKAKLSIFVAACRPAFTVFRAGREIIRQKGDVLIPLAELLGEQDLIVRIGEA